MKRVIPPPQKKRRTPSDNDAVAVGSRLLDDPVHERDHPVRIQMLQPADGEAAFEAAAHEHLHQPVEQRVDTLFDLLDG